MATPEEQLALFEHWCQGIWPTSDPNDSVNYYIMMLKIDPTKLAERIVVDEEHYWRRKARHKRIKERGQQCHLDKLFEYIVDETEDYHCALLADTERNGPDF